MTSFLESLPVEMLCGILGYIDKIEDLKSICLTSKRLSAVSTPSLYQNLIISDDLNNTKEMYRIIKEITKGEKKNLQYVQTLHVGICSKETTAEIDTLLAALKDNSLCRFSYLFSKNSEFPKESQSRYICLHQKRISNLHFGYFFEVILYFPPKIRENFLSSITELSILLSHSYENNLKFSLPLWVMRTINSFKLRKLEVFRNMTISNLGFPPFFTIWPTPNLTHLSFIEYFFSDGEVNLATMPNLTHLILKNCYNILSGLNMIPETKLKSLELQDTNTNLKPYFNNILNYNNNDDYSQCFLYLIKKFKGLETIIIKVGIDNFIEQDNKDFADAIQRHKETLNIFILQFREQYFPMSLDFHPGLIDAIITCTKLTQLCLEIDFIYFREKINKLIENLPDLRLLYLVLTVPLANSPAEEIDLLAENMLEIVPISSKLSLLCFRFRLVGDDSELDQQQADYYVKCFFRSRVGETSGYEKEQVTTITTKQAVYLVRESSIIRKLEPWLFQQLEPRRWFEE